MKTPKLLHAIAYGVIGVLIMLIAKTNGSRICFAISEMLHMKLTDAWVWYLDVCGGNEFMIYTGGTILFTNAVFAFTHLPYLFMDMTRKPKFLYKYKIQDGKNDPLTWKTLKQILKVIIPNILLSILVFVVFYPLQKWRAIDASGSLPCWSRILMDFALCGLQMEAYFYYGHRMFHHQLLYKRFHKIHHEFTAPVSLTAIYGHPVEELTTGYIPVLLSPWILGSHLIVWWIFMASGILWTAKEHCGYHFPFLPSPEAHDYHHLKFNQNFGAIGILDYIHGTSSKYMKSVQYKRDRTFFRLQPIKKTIPAENNS